MGFVGRLVVVCATLTAVAVTSSCRSPADFCGVDCSMGGTGGVPVQDSRGGTSQVAGAPNDGGAGGEPSNSPCTIGENCQGGAGGEPVRSEAGGAAGSSGVANAPNDGGTGGEPITTPECMRDADCADSKACNGAETCHDGRCEAGRAFTCPSISECFEAQAEAACRYSASDRFVVYTGDEFGDPWANAVAVPITRLDAPPIHLNFSQGVMDGEFNSIFDYYWSPDGRRLIFPAATSDLVNDVFDQKFFWLDVSGELDARPRRIPNIPIDVDSWFDVYFWSPSSNVVVIGYGTEKYAVRFSAHGAETALVPTLGYVQPCGDDRTVAYSTADGTGLAAVWDAPSEVTVLPAKLLSRSPDGRWLLLSDKKRAYLARCGTDSKLEALGGPAGSESSWSPNSAYVVYSDAEGDLLEAPTPRKLSAFRVESSAQHTSLFEAVSADPAVNFEPKSTRFLYIEQTPKNERVFRLVDLEKPSSNVALSIPADTGLESGDDLTWYTWWLGTTGRLSYDISDGDAAGTYVIEATANAKPRFVHEYTWGDLRYSGDGTKAVWVASDSEGAGALSQVYTLDLTRSDSTPYPLFAKPMTGSLSIYEPRIIRRFVQDPSIREELFVVPADFQSEPVRVSAGTIVAEPALQPKP